MTIEARFSIPRGVDFTLDVDLQLPGSGVTAFFGPSGCGKTTLLRAIAGLEQNESGYLRVGESIWQNGMEFLPAHQRPLGYVFQEASLFDHLNVRHNLEYGMKRIPAAERRISLEKAIDLLDIGALLQRHPLQLSGGERQRVAIARALAVSPRILLMDEPLAALDLARKQEIMPYLEKLDSELSIPILYISHSPGEVSRLADHLVLMKNGRVTATGPTTELFTRMDLPLAHSDKAAALIDATVAAHDEQYNLTLLDFDGGSFAISRKDLPIGHIARLRVIARDVSLTLEKQTGTSILNIFPATITEISDENPSQVLVKLQVGGTSLLSRITRKSAALLELKTGTPVFAQVKTVALLS